MGKSSGKREASGGKGKGARPSNWSIGALIAVVVAIFAFTSLREPVKEYKPKAAEAFDDSKGYDPDDKLEAIRGALFSEDGVYNFAKDGPGRKGGSRFAHADYWEERYSKAKQDHYDWYGTWNSESKIRIKPHVAPMMPTEVQSVLNLGCGNSRLAEELANDGFPEVMNVDIAPAAIERMKKKFAHVPALRFLQMDITNMTFADSSYDVVFDKGTLDALYTGASELVKLGVAEVFRVLRPGGIFISLTFGPPKSRKDLNRTSGNEEAPPGWEKFVIKKLHKDEGLADKQTFWIYIMAKPN